MLFSLSDDQDKYKTFYEHYSKNIKLAIHEEEQHREKMLDLLRYKSSSNDFVSFREYKERMKEKQTGIYYISGESLNSLVNSPFVDKLKKLEYEVLYMTEPIDEYINQHFKTYKDVKFINVTKDDLNLEDDTKVDEKQYEDLCKKMKTMLDSKVDSVKVSSKIVSQPAIITNPFGMSANMERILKAQALANNNPMNAMMFKMRTLEINPNHPVISKLGGITDDTQFKQLTEMVYNGALLSGGYSLDDINGYLQMIYSYLA
jgi:molecular chaperone HtpG